MLKLNAVVKFYTVQIRLGRITLADVPEKYKDQVAKTMES